MIIFTTLKDIPDGYLEFKGIGQVVKLNLSSYYLDETAINLNKLIPISGSIPEEVITGDCADPEFDKMYHNFIFTNDDSFFQFMAIMVPEFLEPTVLVQIMIS